jgi:hypothetical protein
MKPINVAWTLGMLTLSACGPPPGPPPSLGVAPGSVRGESLLSDGAPPAVRLVGGASNVTSPLFTKVTSTTVGLRDVAAQQSGTSLFMFATFKNPGSLGPGTYDDQIVISVCEDDSCQVPFPGSPWTVPVTYVIRDQMQVSVTPDPPEVTYVAGSSAPPAVQLSIQGQGVHWRASTSFSWIHLGAVQGTGPATVAVTLDASGLGVGDHYGDLVVTDTATGEYFRYAVKLTVQSP